jgi:hypothetical protein
MILTIGKVPTHFGNEMILEIIRELYYTATGSFSWATAWHGRTRKFPAHIAAARGLSQLLNKILLFQTRKYVLLSIIASLMSDGSVATNQDESEKKKRGKPSVSRN